MMKVKKHKGKMVQVLNDIMRIGVAFERLAFFGAVFLLMCHVISCLWVFLAKLEDYGPDTWVARKGY